MLERASKYSTDNYKIDALQVIDYLSRSEVENYHYFSHYWFYKMDWIIWDLSEIKDAMFKFTARNSIEHISPQNPQTDNDKKNQVSKDYLNSFGNLALISVSHNSSFSNKGFEEKIGYFNEKNIKNLKMTLIKNHGNWGDDQCIKHLEDCINKIKEYYCLIH